MAKKKKELPAEDIVKLRERVSLLEERVKALESGYVKRS